MSVPTNNTFEFIYSERIGNVIFTYWRYIEFGTYKYYTTHSYINHY